MNDTTVMNLMTNELQFFSLPPAQAVKAAYLQSRGNYNTWEYLTIPVPLMYGQYTVSCGDFCAVLPPRKEND